MPHAFVNDIQLFYKQVGSGHDLILISGFTATHEIWKPLISQLQDQYKITLIDNRGAGQSAFKDIDYSIELMANDIKSLMDYLNIPKAYVIGHSMGGHILQVLANRYGDHVQKGLFLCSSLLKHNAYEYHVNINIRLGELGVNKEIIIRNQASFLFGSRFLNDDKRLRAYVKTALCAQHPQSAEGFYGQVHARSQFDRLINLPNIKVPIKALFGEEDLITLTKSATLLKKTNASIDIEWLEHCGHMPHIEEPEYLANIILRYFMPH